MRQARIIPYVDGFVISGRQEREALVVISVLQAADQRRDGLDMLDAGHLLLPGRGGQPVVEWLVEKIMSEDQVARIQKLDNNAGGDQKKKEALVGDIVKGEQDAKDDEIVHRPEKTAGCMEHGKESPQWRWWRVAEQDYVVECNHIAYGIGQKKDA